MNDENLQRGETYGFPSLPAVDKAMAFGSFKPAATASSNHLRNCKMTNDLIVIQWGLSIDYGKMW